MPKSRGISTSQPARCRDCAGNAAGGAKGRCQRCYHAWRRAGSPEDASRPALQSGWYGYSPQTGTARNEAAS